jgi:hypothetical protein
MSTRTPPAPHYVVLNLLGDRGDRVVVIIAWFAILLTGRYRDLNR